MRAATRFCGLLLIAKGTHTCVTGVLTGDGEQAVNGAGGVLIGAALWLLGKGPRKE